MPAAEVTITPLPASSNPVGLRESTPAPGNCNQRSLSASACQLLGIVLLHKISASGKWAESSSEVVTTTDSVAAAPLRACCDAGVKGNVLTTFRLLDTFTNCLSKCSQKISISEQTQLIIVSSSSSSLYDVKHCDKGYRKHQHR